MRRRLWALASAALAAGCGSGTTTTSTGAGGSGTTTSTTSTTETTAVTSTVASTTASGTGATTSSTGAGPACNPTPGSAVINADCDLLELAVLQHDGLPTDIVLGGRVSVLSTTMPSCAAIDGVDVIAGQPGSTLIQHLDGTSSFKMDGAEHEIARASPAATDFIGKCGSDAPSDRFEGYGIVVHGRVDGGSFTAQCARASNGGHWPPSLRLTCHRNVDAPGTGTDATEQTSSFMGMSFTTAMLYAFSPHGAGGGLTNVNGDVFVIPLRDPFDPGPPLVSHDIPGWMGTSSEQPYLGETATQLEMLGTGDLLGPDLCPPPPTGMPMFGPPVFISRVTGTGGHGAFSTEMFVTGCANVMTGGG